MTPSASAPAWPRPNTHTVCVDELRAELQVILARKEQPRLRVEPLRFWIGGVLLNETTRRLLCPVAKVMT